MTLPFDLSADTPLTPLEKRALIITMTARTGSTNLCSVLAKLGTFGKPVEAFNARGAKSPLGEQNRRLGGCSSASEYLTKIAQPPDIFCFKVCWRDWAPFASRAHDVFPNAVYVHLHRLDIDAQARSLCRAQVSSVWHRKTGDPPPPPVEIDPIALARCHKQIEAEQAAWRAFFLSESITPLTLAYERVYADLPKAVSMICAHAGVQVPPSDVPAGTFAIMRPPSD